MKIRSASPWSVHVGSVVDNVAVGHFFTQYYGCTLSVSFNSGP